MGWIPNWSSGKEASSESTSNPDTIPEAPNRTSRAKCWDSRDLFFECLNKNNILDAVKDDEGAKKQCSKELGGFEQNCASSWVLYFKQRRVAEYEKEQILKRQEEEMFPKK